MSLRELQENFANAMFASDAAIDAGVVGACGLEPTAALAIYRNNILANYLGGLKITYPVVQALLGEDCFAAVARDYAIATPSHSGDLNDFGGDFDQWVGSHLATREIAYLPDVTRLEWTIDVASRAADGPKIDLVSLGQIAPESLGALRFQLHPSVRLLSTVWPALEIWRAHQGTAADLEKLQIFPGHHHYLILRTADNDVSIIDISQGTHALLSTLQNAESLGTALDAAQSVEADFDLGGQLQQHIMLGTLSNWAL